MWSGGAQQREAVRREVLKLRSGLKQVRSEHETLLTLFKGEMTQLNLLLARQLQHLLPPTMWPAELQQALAPKPSNRPRRAFKAAARVVSFFASGPTPTVLMSQAAGRRTLAEEAAAVAEQGHTSPLATRALIGGPARGVATMPLSE